MKEFCAICALETFNPDAITQYREAVRLHVYYSRRSKELSIKWRDVAHRVLREAIEDIQKTS